MKMIKDIIICYIIGYFIFNIFAYITQLGLYMALGIDKSLVDTYIFLIKNNIMQYTIFYWIILLLYFTYNMFLIKKLNKKLMKIKKVGVEDEK